jgi:hypothetical protein
VPHWACAFAFFMSVAGCIAQPIDVPLSVSLPQIDAAPRHRYLPPMPMPYYGEGGPSEFQLEEDYKLSEIQARLGALVDRLALRQRELERSIRHD